MNLKERVYDYLTTLTEPKSIKEINSHEEFKDVERRELASVLIQLQLEDIAFRKVVEGKAYYSADPKQGTSRNPMQLFIANMASAMNKSLNLANPLEQLFGHQMEVEMEEVDLHAADILNVTYDQNTKIDTEEYSISIPDGFVVLENEQERDFIAYLPHPENPDDKDMAPITLFAGQRLVNASFNEIPTAEARMIALQQMILSTPQFNVAQTRTFQRGDVSGMYMYFHDMCAYHLNVHLPMPGCLKMFRIMLMDMPKEHEEKVFEFADNWLATIQMKNEFPKPVELDDDKFFHEFNDDVFEQWKASYEQTVAIAQNIMTLKGNCEALKFQNAQRNGKGSVTLVKKEIRKFVEEAAHKWAVANAKAMAFFRYHKDNISFEELLKMYNFLKEKFAIEEINIHLDDDKISSKVEQLDEFKAEIETTEIKAYLLAEQERQEALRKQQEENREKERKLKIYREATDLMVQNDEKNLQKAIEKLETIRDFDDAESKIEEAKQRIEQIKYEKEQERIAKELARKESIYNEANELLQRNDVINVSLAKEKFEMISDFKDANEKMQTCDQVLADIAAKEKAAKEAKAKKIKNRILLAVAGLFIGFASVLIWNNVISPMITYNSAVKLVEEGNYDEAMDVFKSLGDYKDSKEQILATKYAKGIYLRESKDFNGAEQIFKELGDYEDSQTQITETYYAKSKNYMEEEEYEEAYNLFMSIDPYKESTILKNQCATEVAKAKTDVFEKAEWYEKAENLTEANKALYDYVVNHKDSTDVTTYQCLTKLIERNYEGAQDIYDELYTEISVNIIFNTKYADLETDLEEIKYLADSQSVVAHILVTGGYPGQEMKVRFVYERRSGFNNKPNDYVVKEDTMVTLEAGKNLVKSLNTGSNIYYHRITLYTEDGILMFQKEVHTPYK